MLRQSRVVYHVLFAMAIAGIDGATKIWAVRQCQHPRAVFPGMTCHLTYNSGVVLGITTQHQPLRALALIVQLLLVAMLIGYSASEIWVGRSAYAATAIATGGIANMATRFWYPGVIDFIQIGGAGYTWPTHNIADIAITIGVCMLGWHLYKGKYA